MSTLRGVSEYKCLCNLKDVDSTILNTLYNICVRTYI